MKESNYSGNVRIGAELLNRIKAIADECGVSNAAVVNSAISYALEHAEIKTETKMIEVKTVAFK